MTWSHNSCAALEDWARSICLIMFLDGTGGPFSSDPVLRQLWLGSGNVLDFTDVFAPSMVFGRAGLFCAKQTVPRSEIHAETQALRFAPREDPSGADLRQ